jgi:DNA-binding transcriptional regulator GbsR (MarR family)
MQQSTGSFVPVSSVSEPERPRLGAVEAGFIQNWAALAKAFGMDPMLGRVHALAFLSVESISAAEVGSALGLETAQAAAYLESLQHWGAVRAVDGGHAPRFESDGDPWSWFLVTLKERGRREFAPLVQSIRDANRRAQQLRGTLGPGAQGELHRIQRIARFSEFVEQIASLLETFAGVGAGPMMSALRMVSRMRAPRLARI